ncbi:MAG: hypothetical protein ACP5VS_04485 [Desulfomonilaceae bacterium]
MVEQKQNVKTCYYRNLFTISLVFSLLVISRAGSANGNEYLGRLAGMQSASEAISESLNGRQTLICDKGNPAIYIGYMGNNNGIRAGYTGLVLPGTCVSSYFVYSLEGIMLAATAPVSFSRSLSMRLSGSYLVAMKSNAEQEITWLTFPPGIRYWDWTRSSLYGLGAEAVYSAGQGYSFLAGFRWESLTTNFGDPNPDYYFTASGMESALSLQNYQPFIGAQVEQGFGNSDLLLKLIGFPVMLASVQHFNTCNNRGVPFAHVGSANINNGYFAEATGEIRFKRSTACELSGFLSWEWVRGTCLMNLERRDFGPPETVTAATVDFLYDRSSWIFGGKISIPFVTVY